MGRFLKKKAKSMLSEERIRTEPFTTSILDGIDLRETIRNWHEGKIYVRQLDRSPAKWAPRSSFSMRTTTTVINI